MANWVKSRPSAQALTAAITVKYASPLGEKTEYLCPAEACIEAFLQTDAASGSSNRKAKHALCHHLVRAEIEIHFAIHLRQVLEKEKQSCPIYKCSSTFDSAVKVISHLMAQHGLQCVVDGSGKVIAPQAALIQLESMSKIEQLTGKAKEADVYVRPTAAQVQASRKRKAGGANAGGGKAGRGKAGGSKTGAAQADDAANGDE